MATREKIGEQKTVVAVREKDVEEQKNLLAAKEKEVSELFLLRGIWNLRNRRHLLLKERKKQNKKIVLAHREKEVEEQKTILSQK